MSGVRYGGEVAVSIDRVIDALEAHIRIVAANVSRPRVVGSLDTSETRSDLYDALCDLCIGDYDGE